MLYCSCLLTHGSSGLALPCLCVVLLVVTGAEAQEGSFHILTKCSSAHGDHQFTLIHIYKARGSSGQQEPCLCMGSLCTVCSMKLPCSRETEAARDKLRTVFTLWLNTSLAGAPCLVDSEPELQLAEIQWVAESQNRLGLKDSSPTPYSVTGSHQAAQNFFLLGL